MDETPLTYRTAPPPPPPPAYRLFSSAQVAVAAFLLSPVVGAILVALNRKRLGRAGSAWLALGVGVALTGVLVVIGSFAHAGGSVVVIGAAFAVRALGDQDKAGFQAHLASGGKQASWWTSLVIPLVVIGALAGAGFYVVMKAGPLADPDIEASPGQKVHYGSGATEADARRVADVLKEDGFLGGSVETEVSVERKNGSIIVGVIVGSGNWEQAEHLGNLGRMRDHLAARAFPGKDVKLGLRDGEFDLKKTLDGPALESLEIFPGQRITYDAAIGGAEAERLKDGLVTLGFFEDDKKGRDVSLRREGDVDVVGFVVGEGRWDDAEVPKAFETVRAKLAARGLGNGKVRVDLCNAKFEAKRSLGPNPAQ